MKIGHGPAWKVGGGQETVRHRRRVVAKELLKDRPDDALPVGASSEVEEDLLLGDSARQGVADRSLEERPDFWAWQHAFQK